MNEIKRNEFFETGKDGVREILTPDDKKIDIIEFDDKKLCLVKSGMGYPAIYLMHETHFEPKAEAILMDLDGTSVHTKKYISDMFGGILYKIVETKIKPEEIRYEMNRYIPATRNSEEYTKRLFKKYFYDVVIHKDRKPGIYLEFDDHMHQLFSIEFFKRLIVRYLRE